MPQRKWKVRAQEEDRQSLLKLYRRPYWLYTDLYDFVVSESKATSAPSRSNAFQLSMTAAHAL